MLELLYRLFGLLIVFHSACCFADLAIATDELSDLPPPTKENLRWALPADAWELSDQHLLKGKFFRFSGVDSKNPGKREGKVLKIYDQKDYTKANWIEVEPGALWDNKIGCAIWPPVKGIEVVWQCNNGHCDTRNQHSTGPLRSYLGLGQKLLKSTDELDSLDKREDCPYQVEFKYKHADGGNINKSSVYEAVYIRETYATGSFDYSTFYFLKPVEIAKDKSYISILVNGKKHYIDTRICQKLPENCQEVTVAHSDYELDWIKLKKIQQTRSSALMNKLIKELLPCVLSKDVQCVQGFFPSKADQEYDRKPYDPRVYEPVKVDSELLAELKACLDYKNLLPHLYGSRGINKVCYFRSRADLETDPGGSNPLALVSVTYPEGVRVYKDDAFYVVKVKK